MHSVEILMSILETASAAEMMLVPEPYVPSRSLKRAVIAEKTPGISPSWRMTMTSFRFKRRKGGVVRHGKFNPFARPFRWFRPWL